MKIYGSSFETAGTGLRDYLYQDLYCKLRTLESAGEAGEDMAPEMYSAPHLFLDWGQGWGTHGDTGTMGTAARTAHNSSIDTQYSVSITFFSVT